MRCRLWIVLGVVAISLACSKAETGDTPEPGQPADSAAAVTEQAAAIAAPTETSLVGDWSLTSAPAQRMPGMRLTITVDSAAGAALWGRLTNYFAGNMGTSPEAYQPFTAAIDEEGEIDVSIPATDPDYLGIVFAGVLVGDSIALDTFVLGPDTMTNGNLRWALVKNR